MHEIKHDGFRLMAQRNAKYRGGNVQVGLVVDDSLAVDQARAHRQRDRGDDERKPCSEIVAVAKLHALGVASRHEAKAIVLNLVDPVDPVGTAPGLWLTTVDKAR